jgi:hypothetical protein
LNASEVLSRARELINEPAKWTQGESARNDKGRHTDADSDLAVCWCTLGAVHKACEGDPVLYNTAANYLDAVVNKQGYKAKTQAGFHGDVIVYNDKPGRRHKEIMELFDQAIACATNSTAPE